MLLNTELVVRLLNQEFVAMLLNMELVVRLLNQEFVAMLLNTDLGVRLINMFPLIHTITPALHTHEHVFTHPNLIIYIVHLIDHIPKFISV